MPLNYSKWDRLELSDDSDIEGHPNVDHKSLVKWKQRDIHEKREARKAKIAKLEAEIACNNVLQPRIEDVYAKLENADPSPSVYFNNLVEQLEQNPSPDAPPTNAPGQPTYDAMMLSLLLQVSKAARDTVGGLAAAEKGEKVGKALRTELGKHLEMLKKTTGELKKDLEVELAEQKKHITSEDIHDGFDSKYVPPKPEPPPVPHAKVDKPKKKVTTTEFEVLNPGASSAGSSKQAASSSTPDPEDDAELDEELPELTPSLEAFSRIKLQQWEESFEFIKTHRDVVVPGASDALLVAGFRAESAGKSQYAKQCVHQSLLLQYGEKLGGDGVGVFFKKMIAGDKRAIKVFTDDVETTYNHLRSRVKTLREEEAQSSEGKEQIQLVAENPDTVISFNVPEGPAPDEIKLEGPGTEGLDIAEVRKALDFRWTVFCGFPEKFQAALKEGTLEGVNKVLAEMDVPEAENIVSQLDMAGILSFAEGGIRDETGKDKEN
ncbi:hsp90 co-chaperone Cdc37 [Pleurotus pulmonarius]|nr:hsp90 co-chaperone Cdc37 [Pleurotus pulmonarius]KAF4590289.1 hsp90 co-chaperone Cdc37 [Pleurotus pulmonarius]KAF4590723.1 hsp90 co-chaperone Cdc37 [Pleurotus pulmonarius]